MFNNHIHCIFFWSHKLYFFLIFYIYKNNMKWLAFVFYKQICYHINYEEKNELIKGQLSAPVSSPTNSLVWFEYDYQELIPSSPKKKINNFFFKQAKIYSMLEIFGDSTRTRCAKRATNKDTMSSYMCINNTLQMKRQKPEDYSLRSYPYLLILLSLNLTFSLH